jgi:hypothetical protein
MVIGEIIGGFFPMGDIFPGGIFFQPWGDFFLGRNGGISSGGIFTPCPVSHSIYNITTYFLMI